jgi:hypothetical protein
MENKTYYIGGYNMNLRQEIINNSRLSVAKGNDTSAVYFNNTMVLVLLERNKLTGDCLFYRPNTYDYVIGKRATFNGFIVEWASGSYLNSIIEVAKEWRL